MPCNWATKREVISCMVLRQVNSYWAVETEAIGGFQHPFIRSRIMRVLNEKQALGVALALILGACVTLPCVHAQDESLTPTVTQGDETALTDIDPVYGRRLITVSMDYVESLRPDSERPDQHTEPDEQWEYYTGLRRAVSYQHDPIWSPDGSLIAFVNSGNIYTVPAEGGIPTIIWDRYSFYEYEGLRYYMNMGGYARSLCFTPDGTEILFDSHVIDEERGTVVTPRINEDGVMTGYHIDDAISVIKAVTITTGETRIAEDRAMEPQFSRDGRYFSFKSLGNPGLTVRALETGMEWTLRDVPMWNRCFSGDGHDIIYEWDDQFYRIPTIGGEKEQISFDESSLLISRRYSPDSSPAGDFVLFEGNGGPRSKTFYDEDGNSVGGYNTSSMEKICVFSVDTGLSYPLFPIEGGIESKGATFSPDGTQLCYTMDNRDVRGFRQGIFIKDFDGVSFMDQAEVWTDETVSIDLP